MLEDTFTFPYTQAASPRRSRLIGCISPGDTHRPPHHGTAGSSVAFHPANTIEHRGQNSGNCFGARQEKQQAAGEYAFICGRTSDMSDALFSAEKMTRESRQDGKTDNYLLS
jgi:hypothetical protein